MRTGAVGHMYAAVTLTKFQFISDFCTTGTPVSRASMLVARSVVIPISLLDCRSPLSRRRAQAASLFEGAMPIEGRECGEVAHEELFEGEVSSVATWGPKGLSRLISPRGSRPESAYGAGPGTVLMLFARDGQPGSC